MVEIWLFWAGPGDTSSANTFLQCWGPQQPTWWTLESSLVPNPPEWWLWAVPPLCWTQIIRLKAYHVLCSFLGLPPTFPVTCLCDTVWEKGVVHITWRVQHSRVAARHVPLCLNCYTMVEDVILCPEMFPLPPPPSCQNKYLIWKSRYRSQLDCTKGPVSFQLLLLLFF